MKAASSSLQRSKICQLNFVLKNAGDVVGYACYYPVERSYLLDVLAGRAAQPIPIDKFLPFVAGIPLDIYIFVVAVKPGFPPDTEKHYGLRLMSGIVEHFRQLGERGVTIENLYARSWTTSGTRLCKKLGMKGEEFENEPGRWLFSLSISSSDSLLVQEYKHAYQDYFASQSEKG